MGGLAQVKFYGSVQIPQALKHHWVETKRAKNPTDRGQQGCKRHILTDGQGLPLAITLNGANRHDLPKFINLETLSNLLDEAQRQQLFEAIEEDYIQRGLSLELGLKPNHGFKDLLFLWDTEAKNFAQRWLNSVGK
jgi:hypothetical protein